jgi:hypothetical protein
MKCQDIILGILMLFLLPIYPTPTQLFYIICIISVFEQVIFLRRVDLYNFPFLKQFQKATYIKLLSPNHHSVQLKG